MVLDKLKEGLKKGVKALAHGTKMLATNISVNIAYNQKKKELKRALLNRFIVRQLEEIALEKGISFHGTNPITGEKWVAVTKATKVKVLAKQLSFGEVVELARRYHIPYRDLVNELERYRAKLESKMAKVKAENKIAEVIQALQEFKPEPVRDEEELEKQLYQYLKARLPGIPIQRQVYLGPYRIDLQVGPCGVELKIPRSKTHLQRLIGQVRDYSEYLDCMVTLILDTGQVSRLTSYIETLEETGIIPIIIQGRLKQKQEQPTKPAPKHYKPKRHYPKHRHKRKYKTKRKRRKRS
ncbi:MAG: hypothetical protein DRO40_05765 [Thermoprotei archaeon]|nr:MAG: hypothetical protein DRO40_05765 [Thermoprotei archaeon]